MKRKPDWYYRQSAVIPYRTKSGNTEILLITSRRKKKWIIPKGIVELGFSARESAAQEAEEEAGVRGSVDNQIIGEYEYRKWGGVCKVKVYPLLVTEVLKEWLEDDVRKRKWFPLSKAIKKVKKDELKKILQNFKVTYVSS